MLLRRMSGCVLAMALLLGVAWPTVCSACRPASAEEECGAKHGAAGHEHDARIRLNPACQDCGTPEGIAARRSAHRHSEAAAIQRGNFFAACSGASLQNARFERYQRPSASPLVVGRILTMYEAGKQVDSPSSRPYSSKTFLENPVTLLRSVRLKL